jgi:hypothetical protein
VTVAGSNADLDDPLGWALRQLGYTVADITSVTSAEVVSVSTTNLDKFLDFSEYRVLENILGNLDVVDTKLGPRSESLSQLARQVQSRLDKLAKKLEDLYGFNAPFLEAGFLELDFAQHNEKPASE